MYFSVQLLPIPELKPHEKTILERVCKIKEEISKSGEVLSPLWVDSGSNIVLNGHHRLQALKELGCSSAPCLLFDYRSQEIEVQICPGASVSKMSKELVIQSALSGNLFPPRSSFHVLRSEPNAFPVPLSILRMESFQLQPTWDRCETAFTTVIPAKAGIQNIFFAD
ncbi:MAG: ParB N-terminal domain-containing protein [Elusimicrobia bacterium]|nr:ParB N-terminal domain-containing protein [Elusimicrobiota bacterium]